MSVKLLVPQKEDRAKVVGKILDPRPGFVVWAPETCCFTSCTRC